MRREAYFEILLLRCRSGTGSVWQVDDGAAVHTTHVCHTHGTVEAEYSRLAICGNFNYVTHCFPESTFIHHAVLALFLSYPELGPL